MTGLRDAVLEFTVVTDATFPHGLRCAECHRSIGVGQPFVSAIDGVYDNGDTAHTLKCVYC